MSDSSSSLHDPQYVRNATAAALQIGLVAVLAFWCLSILMPFLGLVVWAAIIAIALYPLHLKLASVLSGRQKTSATLIVLILLVALLMPTYSLTESSVIYVKDFATELHEGHVKVPPPNDSVKDWPLIGDRVHGVWAGAAANLEATLNQFAPQLTSVAGSIARSTANTLLGILGFAVSIIIAGVFLVSAPAAYSAFRTVGTRLAGERGADFTDLSVATIRSVAKGVLGVAFIQAMLAAIGLVMMDVPGAGIWAGVVLLLAIMQLPPLLVLGPIAIWVFSTAEAVPATLFLVYALFVSFSDAILKPALLGRGVDVPTLVILLGAIGGMVVSGIIGLFTGAVILGLGYKLFMFWLHPEEAEEELESVHGAGESAD